MSVLVLVLVLALVLALVLLVLLLVLVLLLLTPDCCSSQTFLELRTPGMESSGFRVEGLGLIVLLRRLLGITGFRVQ